MPTYKKKQSKAVIAQIRTIDRSQVSKADLEKIDTSLKHYLGLDM